METVNVFDLIERMATLVRSEERKRCTEFGLQPVHLQALDYLSRCNRYSDTPAALTNYLGMTRGTVSQTLLLLEKKAYIQKTTDNADRRIIHLSLLPEGELILNQARQADLFKRAAEIFAENAFIDAENIFMAALTALQKANSSKSFGLCKTCQYFTNVDNGFHCGLTKGTLSHSDSEKICQEHSVVGQNKSV